MINRRVDVVTVFAPRPHHEKWMDYLPLLELQRRSTARQAGHNHIVVGDADLPGFDVMKVALPEPLMKLILTAQVAYLEQWPGKWPAVLLDVDCLVNKNLLPAFSIGDWDIGLTHRASAVSPINNGAMYIAAGARDKALKFFSKALSICKDHWGGDQEAISECAAPVPRDDTVQMRDGIRIGYLPMHVYNIIPEVEGAYHRRHPYIIHFKGEKKKPWMKVYSDMYYK